MEKIAAYLRTVSSCSEAVSVRALARRGLFRENTNQRSAKGRSQKISPMPMPKKGPGPPSIASENTTKTSPTAKIRKGQSKTAASASPIGLFYHTTPKALQVRHGDGR